MFVRRQTSPPIPKNDLIWVNEVNVSEIYLSFVN